MVAGKRKLEWSYFIPKKRALEMFPMLRTDSLVGALVYYDGEALSWSCALFIALWGALLLPSLATWFPL